VSTATTVAARRSLRHSLASALAWGLTLGPSRGESSAYDIRCTEGTRHTHGSCLAGAQPVQTSHETDFACVD
jgi:hypothetical protein